MRTTNTLACFTALALFVACGPSDMEHDAQHAAGDEHDADGHERADGEGDHGAEEGHAHDEEPLGSARIGELDVELAQGHSAVVAGAEGHLVVKLPYSDQGATVVRAWIGTEDRLASYVGKGEYAPSHDDYDVHAMAPDPLPADAKWWIEIERPDGTKQVGSATPILE